LAGISIGSAKLRRMRGVPWRLLAAGCLTAALLDLPFPIAGPLPLWRTVFAWFALTPLLVGLLGMDFARRRRWVLGWAFAAGWLTGALWFGANCYWVYDTMHLYGGMDRPMAAVALVAFSLYLGFWFGVFALALVLVRRATVGGRFAWMAVAAIPLLWVGMEFALARIPGFPWDLLGYSQVDNPLLMRLAPWTGVYGVSFLLSAVNALLAAGWVVRNRQFAVNRHPLLQVALSGKVFGSYGLVLMLLGCAGLKDRPPAPSATATAVLVQPNLDVDKDDVWVGPDWDRHVAQFGHLGVQTCGDYLAGIPRAGVERVAPQCSLPFATPSLVIWPESPAPFRDADPRFQSAMESIAQADKAPLIVGAIGMDAAPDGRQYQIYNSAVVVAQDGHFVGRYDKIHLVPFGEYVPFRRLLFFVRQVAQSMSDMSIGTERKVFRLSGADGQAHRYGVFICYESVFGDEVRQFARLGAEVFVNISDDGWYGDTSAPWQHLNMARMRAIENRRWILRDTNTGVTAAIDPYGTVRQSIPRHEVGALAARYGFDSELTFYTLHGDWVGWICAIFALGITAWAARATLYR
jgi:apolipoprotein N-acyltransferase